MWRAFCAESTILLTSGSNAIVTPYSSPIAAMSRSAAADSSHASGVSFSGWVRHMCAALRVPVERVMTCVPSAGHAAASARNPRMPAWRCTASG